MIIDIRTSLIVFGSLFCWDRHDEPIHNIVWFDTDEMVCSARRAGAEERVVVGRYCLRTDSKAVVSSLRDKLPEELHDKIELSEEP